MNKKKHLCILLFLFSLIGLSCGLIIPEDAKRVWVYTFQFEDILQLRNDSEEAKKPTVKYRLNECVKDEKAPYNLLKVHPTLKLKKGYKLCGFIYSNDLGSYGQIIAYPENMKIPTNFPDLKNHPKEILQSNDIMNAIDGDKSPWSYLSAAIFLNEARDFGMYEEAPTWKRFEIIGENPEKKNPTREHKPPSWPHDNKLTWIMEKPDDWSPKVKFFQNQIVVELYVCSGYIDYYVFKKSYYFNMKDYNMKFKHEVMAKGKGGYVF